MLHSVGRFSKYLSIILVAQVLLALLTTNAQAGVIKKREIAASANIESNDPDIAAESGGGSASKLEATNTHENESENVTKISTKLIPQAATGGAAELKPVEKIILNRVEENYTKGARMEEQHAIDTTNVFSQNLDTTLDAPELKPISNNVNNGLDVTAVLPATKDASDAANKETTIAKEEQSATTEVILSEIEKIAVVQTQPSNSTAKDNSKAEHARSIATGDAQNIASTTMYAVPIAVKLATPASNYTKEITASASGDIAIEATTTESIEEPRHNSTLGAPVELIESAPTTHTTLRPNIGLARSNENSIEESNEQHTVGGSGGNSEKRGKYISDATNAKQLNLPDSAEVWTLAGMKTVPKTNSSTDISWAVTESGAEVVGLSTEKTIAATAIASNSEKNLLDWTQIMLSGELEAKAEATATTSVPKSPDTHENQTEMLIKSTIDTTDDGDLVEMTKTQGVPDLGEHSSTHLPNIENEITVETTTVLAGSPTTTADGLVINSIQEPVTTSTPTMIHLASTSMSEQLFDSSTAPTKATALSNDNSDKSEFIIANSTAGANLGAEQTSSTERGVLPVANSNEVESKTIDAATTEATTGASPASVVPPVEQTSVSSFTSPPPTLDASYANVSAVTLNTNKKSATGDDEKAETSSEKHADDALELSSSKTLTNTLSTLAAGEANTSANEEESVSWKSEKYIEASGKITTTDVDKSEASTQSNTTSTSTIATTAIPIILATNTKAIATTEVSHIGNEVDLDVNTEQSVSSSTIETLLKAADGNATQLSATTSYENELLISTTTTTTTTTTTPVPITITTTASTSPSTTTTTTTTTETAAPIQEIAISTTLSPPLLSPQQTTGSVTLEVVEETTTTTTTAPPAVVVVAKPNEATNKASHESESSIETNVIDPSPGKPTTKDTTGEQTEKPVIEQKVIHAVEGGNRTEDEDINAAVTTTMGTPVNTTISTTTATITTTTEAPLISLLDDSSTTTTKATITTSAVAITTKKSHEGDDDEVYAIVPSTTESANSSLTGVNTTEKATTTTETLPTPTTGATVDYQQPTKLTTLVPRITEAVVTAASSTTMLPPTIQHASIGGAAMSPPNIPPMSGSGNNLHANSADAPETDVNVIIAITVSVIGVIALILLVAFLYLIRKRQKQVSYGQRCRPVSLDAYSLDNVSVLGSVRRKGALRASKRSYGNIAFDDPSLRHNLLTAAELVKFVEKRSSIFEEFRDVPQIIARADEVPHGCEDKNRYANVIPLPETRVVLQLQHDDEKTEYINANYVRGPKDAPNYYIACQAPLETTVNDFWRMIWEQQSRVIIQATDLTENGIEKCAEYLPPSATLDNSASYGDYQVTLKNREVKDKYAISTIMLKHIATEESRELTHYWYKWPEAGVPAEEAPIIAMLLEARSSLKSYANELKEKSSTLTLRSENENATTNEKDNNGLAKKPDVAASNGEINGNVSGERIKMTTTAKNQGPLTIHCSPGTGRAGTIIACDMAIRSLETPKRSVDIPQIVYYVRRGRASAVQTKEQYEFIYKVANMYATKITSLSNDN